MFNVITIANILDIGYLSTPKDAVIALTVAYLLFSVLTCEYLSKTGRFG